MHEPDDPLTLPRSVHLALWTRHVGAGAESLRRALDAVQGDDEPHDVVADDDSPVGDGTLGALLATWASGPRTAAAVLPVPGDPAGAPADASTAALAAGECVLVETPDGAFAAVPDVRAFGSALEPGHLVTWHVRRVRSWSTVLLGVLGTPAEAEQELRLALGQATEALTSLDVARWRPDAAAAIARLRGDTAPTWHLPAELDPRRVRVLTLAARLRGVVALATSDDGGAVNLWQADQRSTALREIDHAARRALSAVTVG
ncbi:hypothetical protein N866_08240 [Actinotalea ferrariae CF5-4]|uniref:Uncharacterized protein n=1 Tax=Actinotalea ferrariae CF5-4 TaxID=948458 RepID=A0A021VTS9_9CELL|nr:hypothetical protein [Actinotalea ferrariae]EYR62472.1 hypothetical protein N866_08240 [Actinotalea ferrariae CF5-4]